MTAHDAPKPNRQFRSLAGACSNDNSTPPPPYNLALIPLPLHLRSAFAFKFLFAALVLLLLPAGPAFAATFNVATAAQLRTAFNTVSNSNGEPDTINMTANITANFGLYVTEKQPLTLNGNGYTLTLTPGEDVIEVYTGRTLILNNIIIPGRDRTKSGARIIRAVFLDGTLIADRLTVRWMDDSGIRMTEGAKLTVTNSIFSDNNSTAIAMDGGGEVDIRNSRFINNTAEQVSAIKVISSVDSTNNLNAQITTHANVKLYNNLFTGNRSRAGEGRFAYLCYNDGSTCIPFTNNDFEFGHGAVVVVGGFKTEAANNQVWVRHDVPGTFLDMRGNTISGNSHDCFVSDFVTITPQSYGANTIGPESNLTCLRLHRKPSVKQAAAGDGLVYIPPTATPSATATPGISSCLTLPGIVTYNITESTQCQRLDAVGIGNAEIAAAGFVDAINVWSWILPGTKICFEAEGSAFKFIDTTALPRVVYDLPATNENGLTCGIIDRPGNLILLPGARPPAAQMQAPAPQEAALSGCMVRTQYILNFRASPGGDVIRAIPFNATLTAVARTADWFKVDFHGVKGWISADFVEPIGTCG